MMAGVFALHDFFAAFIPLFVSIDAFGLVPIFIGITDGMGEERRRQITFQAAFFALAICLAFMLLGRGLFGFLGITQADFRIAGGVLLLVLAIIDLLIRGKPAVDENQMIGLFPLAMPLIAGPATMTTTLIIAGRPYGYALATSALALNFLILIALLLGAQRIARLIGVNALRAASKLVMVLLAAIAVNLIRTGIVQAWLEK
ncbi:MAG: MarC family protein [Phycisphaerae bacterium]|nr:MarC family protein [Phycisphaerae bacterium]